MGWIRAAVVALVVMLTGGCFLSLVPAIAPDQAEDVGDELAYKVYFATPDTEQGIGFLFRRGQGRVYVGYSVDAWGNETLSDVDAGGSALIRRLGKRGEDPVYLIQMGSTAGPMTEPLVLGVVAIRADGVGVQRVFACDKPGFSDLAARFGLRVECAADAPHLVSIRALGEGGDLAAFLEAVAAAGLSGWEDDLGVSIYQEILSGL